MVAGLAHVLGLDDAGGPWYLFWSGFGSDLPMLGAVFLLVRKYNCAAPNCIRIARYACGDYMMCSRHHHEPPPTRRNERTK